LLAFFSSIIFVCVTVFYNLHEFRTFCSATYDFALFLQVIKDFSWHNMNPYLLNLNVSFLNDHWHPGLILDRIPGLFFFFINIVNSDRSLFFVSCSLGSVFVSEKKSIASFLHGFH
jgi:hypothetical protein